MRLPTGTSEYNAKLDTHVTTWTINPGDDDSNEAQPGERPLWANMQWLNSGGDGYDPHATTFGAIATKIPSKPSLKKSCDKCWKKPDQDGTPYAACASCKVSRYCSRDCQTSHWKEHKPLCRVRVQHAQAQLKEAPDFRAEGTFVSQTALRKWYYDNVDIVDYAIVQLLQLYKGDANSLWRTHAVLFSLKGGKEGTDVAADDLDFSDASATSFTDLARPDRLELNLPFLQLVGAGKRIILIFIPNRTHDLMLIDSHDLPEESEWAAMEQDNMWRMHIRMRDMAREMVARDSV
ncbi:MYND-type domain-containing protein [Mycena indigotica]|uniref:MYND-type domain-containing protein n=1 Tax=Mycena indigotica TaxID=2126181 RepID=A0A8H6W176_9AGAR|nr:MYND-type domain-containing protein [Mycena indigotica]KAF7295644.1 MYND-type domain-containing protein [Mycena indigotica]